MAKKIKQQIGLDLEVGHSPTPSTVVVATGKAGLSPTPVTALDGTVKAKAKKIKKEEVIEQEVTISKKSLSFSSPTREQTGQGSTTLAGQGLSLVEPIYHITHNDLDGAGCMMLAKLIGITDNRVASYTERKQPPVSEDVVMTDEMEDVKKPISYFFNGIVDTAIEEDGLNEKFKTLLITDISIGEDFAKNLVEKVSKDVKIVIIDHHEDTLDSYEGLDITKDVSACATQLFYDRISETKDISQYKDLVNAINSFDTWQFDISPFGLDLQRTFEYVRSMISMPKGDKSNSLLNKVDAFSEKIMRTPPNDVLKPDWYDRYLENYNDGLKIFNGELKKRTPNIKNRDRLVQDIVDNKIEHNEVTVFMFLDKINSFDKRGERIVYKERISPGFEVAVWADEREIENKVFIYENNNGYSFSLRRGNNEINSQLRVNEIAAKWGGGGHEAASGFNILIEGKELVDIHAESDADRKIRMAKEIAVLKGIVEEICTGIREQVNEITSKQRLTLEPDEIVFH